MCVCLNSNYMAEYIHDTLKLSDESDTRWNANTVEATSDVHLEDDKGEGAAAIIRVFEFSANPEVFKQHTPTTQELFNAHAQQVKLMLWGDGLEIMEEITPRLKISKNKKNYRIIIGCRPRFGQVLNDTPRTLAELVK